MNKGGFYHGTNHVSYGASICPVCSQSETSHVAPIPDCEVDDIMDGQRLVQLVHCKCRQSYYAVYDVFEPAVGIIPLDPSDQSELWKEKLYDRQN